MRQSEKVSGYQCKAHQINRQSTGKIPGPHLYCFDYFLNKKNKVFLKLDYFYFRD